MDINFVSRKLAVIFYVTILHFFVTSFTSQLLSKILPKYNTKKSTATNYLQLVVVLTSIALVAYLLRQINYPLPLKSDTFDPSKVKETKGSIFTGFVYFMWLGSVINEYKPIMKF
jgi:hypothetical protein